MDPSSSSTLLSSLNDEYKLAANHGQGHAAPLEQVRFTPADDLGLDKIDGALLCELGINPGKSVVISD